jgi:hypothetical protein
MHVRDSVRVAKLRLDALDREHRNDGARHVMAFRERERERRGQIATRCPGQRTR